MGCGLFLRFILLFEFVVLLMGWVWVLLVICRYFGFLLVVVLLFWLWFMLVLHFPCFLVLGGGLAVDDWWLGGAFVVQISWVCGWILVVGDCL